MSKKTKCKMMNRIASLCTTEQLLSMPLYRYNICNESKKIWTERLQTKLRVFIAFGMEKIGRSKYWIGVQRKPHIN